MAEHHTSSNQPKHEPAGEGNVSPGTSALGTAHRQPQRYGASPDPIGTDDEAGSRAAGAPPRDPDATTGEEGGATYGLRTEAMPGTSEAMKPVAGVRRATHEGLPDDVAASDLPVEHVERPVEPRRTGESGPGSAAAARGEVPQPPVEQTQPGDSEAAASHERPVTGVHRPSAPGGEVSPD